MFDVVPLTMKIAIVLLDNYITSNGDFGKLGKELLERVIDGEFIIFDYFNDRSFPDESLFDLIYLTGSRNDAFLQDSFTNELVFKVERVLKSDCKLLGVCYGHQIICRAIGLKVIRNPLGWEMGLTKIKGEIEFSINEMHRDIVEFDELILQKNRLTIIGSTKICQIQGLRDDNFKLLTFQGHPEFNNDVTLEMVQSLVINGEIDEEFAKDCKNRSNCNSSSNVERIIAQFIKSL